MARKSPPESQAAVRAAQAAIEMGGEAECKAGRRRGKVLARRGRSRFG